MASTDTRRGILVVTLVGGLALALAGCGGNSDGPEATDGSGIEAAILEPANDATDVLTATEIVFTAEDAVETTVELTELDGASIDGEITEDESGWRPTAQLEYQTTYVATLTAVAENGENAITTSTFTTMAEPEQTIRVVSFLGDDAEVGVAMPLRLELMDDAGIHQEIPEEHRAEVERRLSVRSEPAQEGTWHWVSGAEVHYRPREHWQAGTQINYQAATGGLPIGDGRYLRNDLSVSMSVGREIILEATANPPELTVTVDGQVERSDIPISLGQSQFPSSSGTFVIMEKFRETEFDTTSPDQLGEDGYELDIEYAMRLTYQGEFIHAAVEGREDILGAENVTHGCMNVDQVNAEWLFNLTHAWGDPVTIEGTGSPAQPGDGWTDWNLDWEQYQQGSALYQE